MFKERKNLIIILLVVLILFLSGILFNIEEKNKESEEEPYIKENILKDIKLNDNKEIYLNYENSTVKKLYVTVLKPENKDRVTLKEVNENINPEENFFNANKDVLADISLNISPVKEVMPANGTIEIRGQSSRLAPQKSYKIKSNSDEAIWKEFKILNLNKHYYDETRIRNKLSFDLMKDIPDITSYRTEFVELYIRDLSQGIDNEYISYGLFTFIEQPNKTYLKDRDLNPSGYFYKAEFFEFLNYKNEIRLKDDENYDNKLFESILEVRGSDNHQKLIEMLEAVNNYSININSVVAKYFDEDNMLTWVAMNILMNNYDTSSRNFMIYSPTNSSKWFFIPWDYDKTWEVHKNKNSYQFGLSNYWGMTLFNRYFREITNIEKLNLKLDELNSLMTPEKIQNLVDDYYKNIEYLVLGNPDFPYLEMTKEEYINELKLLANIPSENLKNYYEEIERPFPFFMNNYEKDNDNNIIFSWGNAFDLQGDKITYEIILSTDLDKNNIVFNQKNIDDEYIVVSDIPAGKYYLSVIATDSQGNYRMPFDLIADGLYYFGIKEIIID